MSIYAVIMAGGTGTRFWPYSRKAQPKQFLNVFGQETLIQATISRLYGLVPPEQCYIVTNAAYVTQTQDQLPALPPENILAEPMSRNTAPCIAFAAAEILKRDPDATMIVLPADHLIHNVRLFHEVLKTAIEKAQEPGAIVTIGIEPTHPETGYGYIQFDKSEYEADQDGLVACSVKAFAEKPDAETAKDFLDSGEFLWNSGMFIWRADVIMQEIETHMPDLADAFDEIRKSPVTTTAQIEKAFTQSPKISIDYGVMEKAQKVYVVPGAFGWNDVGDWRAVFDLSPKDANGNSARGRVLTEDASRNLVFAGDKLVALVGVHDTVVVNTPDAILVCHKETTQQVKTIVEYMQAHQMDDYT